MNILTYQAKIKKKLKEREREKKEEKESETIINPTIIRRPS